MSEKILTRFNIQSDYLALIEQEASKRSITKHEYLNHVIYEFLVKKDNRLSNHIARDNENLLLMLLTSDTKYPSIEAVIEKRKSIDQIKRSILHEQKFAKEDKDFWHQILHELHPDEFVKIKTQSDANEKIKRLFQIIKSNQEVFK